MSEIIKVPTRIYLIRMLPERAVLAEVGCWRGYFATEIMNHAPNVGKLYCVDSWKRRPEYNDPLRDTDHEANLAETKHHLRGHLPGGRVEIIREDSLVAAMRLRDLDCAYLDADHSYDAVYADLIAWSQTLKPTGVLAGHDYTENEMSKEYGWGVIPAVRDFCKNYGWRISHLTNEDFSSYRLERV